MIMKKRKSFTLVELMLIVAIMGILFIAGALKFNDMRKTMKLNKAKAQMKILQVAIKMYFSDTGNFPGLARTVGLGVYPYNSDVWKMYLIDGVLDYSYFQSGGFPPTDEYDSGGTNKIYNWHGPYIHSEDVLEDPWGHRFIYYDKSSNPSYYSAIICQGPSDAVPPDGVLYDEPDPDNNPRYAISNILKAGTKDTLYPPDDEGFSIIPYNGDPNNINSDYNIVLWME